MRIWEIRVSPETASYCTEASSALEVSRKCAIYIYYLLTYGNDRKVFKSVKLLKWESERMTDVVDGENENDGELLAWHAWRDVTYNLRSVSTTRVHGPTSWAENSARKDGPWTRVHFLTPANSGRVDGCRVVETDLYCLWGRLISWSVVALTVEQCEARFPFKRNRLRWQAANRGCQCFDRAFLLAGAWKFHATNASASQ